MSFILINILFILINLYVLVSSSGWCDSCQCTRAVVVQQQIRQSNEINNKSPMRATLFVHWESDLSLF